MQPGDVVRTSNRAVRLVIDVFVPEKQEGYTHIRITGAGGKNTITTVTDCEERKRGHPHLFRQLKKLLRENGCWPDWA